MRQLMTRLIVVLACVACAAEAISETVLLRMLNTYKRSERLAADASYAEQLALVDAGYGLLEDKRDAYTNVTRLIGEELEREQFAATLFLRNVDADVDRLLYRNGSGCRQHVLRQHGRVHEYHNTGARAHRARMAALVAALGQLYDAHTAALRAYGDRIKSSLAIGKQTHDRYLATVPDEAPAHPAPGQL